MENPDTFKPDSWWFRRWEAEYGLSAKKANRKYQVPRSVQKERMELFWTSLFRVRLFILKELGYEPVLLNFDQSPYHHNESGSQNKTTLSVRGANVPIVEGTADIRERWTLNATTCSNLSAVAEIGMPWAECMFKGTPGKLLHENLNAFRVHAGFPDWFAVTIGEKGSYREHDIIVFVNTFRDVVRRSPVAHHNGR